MTVTHNLSTLDGRVTCNCGLALDTRAWGNRLAWHVAHAHLAAPGRSADELLMFVGVEREAT